ncbi:hypothetical protein M8J75_006512 [Diaphorina citri]|nr:hypothetical protein M8J75_006512 [Diaphorina citri]
MKFKGQFPRNKSENIAQTPRITSPISVRQLCKCAGSSNTSMGLSHAALIIVRVIYRQSGNVELLFGFHAPTIFPLPINYTGVSDTQMETLGIRRQHKCNPSGEHVITKVSEKRTYVR